MIALRHQKYLLRILTTGTFGFAMFVLTQSAQRPTMRKGDLPRSADVAQVSVSPDEEPTVDTTDYESLATRPLQRRLFDPPPPPKKEVVKPEPPPLRVKLLGTAINSSNSQAIIQDQRGSVVFRSLGQPVSADHPESVIEEILPSSIRVRRGDRVDTVAVE